MIVQHLHLTSEYFWSFIWWKFTFPGGNVPENRKSGKAILNAFQFDNEQSASEAKSINLLLFHYIHTATEIYCTANNRKEQKEQLSNNLNKKVNVNKTHIRKIVIIKGLQKIGLHQFAETMHKWFLKEFKNIFINLINLMSILCNNFQYRRRGLSRHRIFYHWLIKGLEQFLVIFKTTDILGMFSQFLERKNAFQIPKINKRSKYIRICCCHVFSEWENKQHCEIFLRIHFIWKLRHLYQLYIVQFIRYRLLFSNK